MMVVGALGSLVHVFRSFYWYVGNRALKSSWLTTYFLLPFNGAGLAVLFYFIIRGTNLGQAPANPSSQDGYAAIAALVGMFSRQAIHKIKQIAEAFFTVAATGKDPAVAPGHISGIAPVSGSSAGGTAVTITGTGFAPGEQVTFGGIAATLVSIPSGTRVLATTPVHPAGVVDVTLTTSSGAKSTLPNAFTFLDEVGGSGSTTTAVLPNNGPATGGTQVTIRGVGFTSGSQVSFGGVASTSVSIPNDTQIIATTPAHPAGVVDVTLITSSGVKSTLSNAFTFLMG
jgi:hypothetical protein